MCLGWSVAKVGNAPNTGYHPTLTEKLKLKAFCGLGGKITQKSSPEVFCGSTGICEPWALGRLCLCFGAVLCLYKGFVCRALCRQQFVWVLCNLGALGFQSHSLPGGDCVCSEFQAQLAGILSKLCLKGTLIYWYCYINSNIVGEIDVTAFKQCLFK